MTAALTTEETARVAFMRDMLAGLSLDDPEQPVQRLPRKGWLAFYMPAPGTSCYVSILYKRAQQQIGLRLAYRRPDDPEKPAIARVVEDLRAESRANSATQRSSRKSAKGVSGSTNCARSRTTRPS